MGEGTRKGVNGEPERLDFNRRVMATPSAIGWERAGVRVCLHIKMNLETASSENKKGTLTNQSAFSWKSANYFAPRIASLAALATWNFTTRLAGIWICSPVAGLRPIRAARFFSFNLPRPGSVKVFLAFLYARSASDSRYWVDCFFVMPTFSASVEAI